MVACPLLIKENRSALDLGDSNQKLWFSFISALSFSSKSSQDFIQAKNGFIRS